MPEIDLSAISLHISPVWLVLICIIIFVFIIFAVNRSIKAHRLRVSAGREELIGRTAEVREALEPKGVVFVDGERWAAVSELGRVEPGEEVLITRVDSLRLYVTKKEQGG